MEVVKCTLADLDDLALWSMQAQVDGREDSYWGSVEESPELLAEERKTMEAYLNSESWEIYKFLVEGRVVGHVAVKRHAGLPGALVENFFVHRECRRQGYGTQALHALMEQLGMAALDLDVFCWNQRALSFYKSFGFKEISLHMNYGA